jgi:serine/threonine-protein kinase
LPSGTQLHGGHYAVGRVLGQGGFGITYLGSDARERRTVAIKEFFPFGSQRHGREVRPAGVIAAADFESARTRFADESHILGRFSHPGIVAVYDTFSENNTSYMVMEFLRGKSLGVLLEERGVIPEREAVGYIRRAGEALEVVHAASLLHRDLKPDNLIVTEDGRVVLIDFGTARTFAAGKTGRMTTMVTPGYAPLEQYGREVRFGAFTDIYALAATLYHLLTGQMPAPATDRASGVDLKPPRAVNPAVSQTVSDAVMWALEMRIDRRPQTVRAFIDALAHRPRRAPPDVAPPPQTDPSGTELSPPAAFHWGIPAPAELAYEVATSRSAIRWPGNCACCFAPADTSFRLEAMGTASLFDLLTKRASWSVPYCSRCLSHVQIAASHTYRGAGGAAAATVLAGLVLGGPIGLLIGMGGAAVVASIAAAKHHLDLATRITPRCVAVGPAASYLGRSRRGHVFQFLNGQFADAFARENG